jgi:DNA-directed RNA polymerase subunit RPC12/RpoP
MKTLKEHNETVHPKQDEFKAGVKCDECETEMLLENPYVMLASWPAQQWVVCPKCNYRGLIRR